MIKISIEDIEKLMVNIEEDRKIENLINITVNSIIKSFILGLPEMDRDDIPEQVGMNITFLSMCITDILRGYEILKETLSFRLVRLHITNDAIYIDYIIIDNTTNNDRLFSCEITL